jgi:hypothetical protein
MFIESLKLTIKIGYKKTRANPLVESSLTSACSSKRRSQEPESRRVVGLF